MLTGSLGAATLLAASVSAIPNYNIRPRATDSLAPWVTVAEDGTPKTVTPVLTTISGTPTVISAAPSDLTATVFTQTNFGDMTTSTGIAVPTPTATSGAGAFPVCRNKVDPLAPWCQPQNNANLYPGTTYYFLWDSSYFAPNATLVVQGNYLNSTTGKVASQAFQSDKMSASWGFWPLTVDANLMQGSGGVNISVQIVTLNATAGGSSQFVAGPTILVTNPPVYHSEPAKPPSGAALYIGLPTVFGFIAVCLIGTYIWNRKSRRITLGNIMSRTRHGHGLGKVRGFGGAGGGRRRRERKAAERVQLMEREVAASGGEVYRDAPPPPHIDIPDIPRRDSDALGSLAGTPTEERRMDLGARDGGRTAASSGERNYFRDEMRRQDDARR